MTPMTSLCFRFSPPPHQKAAMYRDARNGVRAVDFIKAVSWCMDSDIQEALADIGIRTNDEAIKEIVTEAATSEEQPAAPVLADSAL